MIKTEPYWTPNLTAIAPKPNPNMQPADVLVHRNEVAQTFVQVVPAGAAIEPHRHTGVWDYFIALSGSAHVTLRVGADAMGDYELKEGGFLAVPPNTTHEIRCIGDQPFVFFLFQTPLSAYDYVTEATI